MGSTTRGRRFLGAGAVPHAVSGTGVALFLASVAEWMYFGELRIHELVSASLLVSLLISSVFTVGLLYGGYWLSRSDLRPDQYPRIVKWFVGGMVFYLAINLPMMAVWSMESRHLQFGWARFAVTVGGVGGLVVGIAEARVVERERAAERAAVRAEEAEQHHRHLDYLNSLLRHEVLNTANVITGYASLLLEDGDLDDDARHRLETIRRQGQDMTSVIRDVQVLLAATRGETEREVKNLSEVVAAELDDLRRTAESVEVEASVPDGVHVRADDLLPRVFANLFANAVQHNDAATPRVEVTAEESDGTVEVRVTDDGPGIPADERATLFERSDNTGGTHGLGLYLVDTLVGRYGGTVELVETGPDGSTFAVELPTVDPGSAATAGERAVLASD